MAALPHLHLNLDELRDLLLLLRDDRLEPRQGSADVDLFSYYWLLLPKYRGAGWWRCSGLLRFSCCFCFCFCFCILRHVVPQRETKRPKERYLVTLPRENMCA